MATISGSLIYDNARLNSANSPGIANVPVVLQNTATGMTLSVLTDSNGKYTFTNVPSGSYQVVEYYGYNNPAPLPSPGDFTFASNQSIITTGGVVPPIKDPTTGRVYANAPADATNLDGVTPTTMKINVNNSDVTVSTIRNGPVKYTPFGTAKDSHITNAGNNLITGIDGGTFGNFEQGHAANQGVSSAPYPDMNSGFQYVNSEQATDGQYSVRNTKSNSSIAGGNWWNISDHTNGNEMGRYDFVNGASPGTTILEQTLDSTKGITPNANYLLSAWIANVINKKGLADPAVSIEVLGENGQSIYKNKLGKSLAANVNEPEWVQVGDIINSGNNSKLTVRLVSEGPAANGNDYAIDDISLVPVNIPKGLEPIKQQSTDTVKIGDTVTYTVKMKNNYDRNITNAKFQDTLPNGLQFVPGTVKVDNVSQTSYDPNQGFSLGTVAPGQEVTVTFDAKVTSLPNPNPAVNTAKTTYDYNYIKDNAPTPKSDNGPGVPLTVTETADVTTTKTSDKTNYLPNEPVTYTITVKNAGPSTAKSPKVSDTVPDTIQNPQYSTDNGKTWSSWPGSLTLPDLAANTSSTVLIKGTLSKNATGSLTNTATTTTPTADKNGNPNNTSSGTTPGNPQVTDTADVTSTKKSDKTNYLPGDPITYTITVNNSGPATAKTPKVSDTLPSKIENPMFSTDNGTTWNPWTGSTTLADLPSGQSASVLIKGTVSKTATGNLANAAETSSATPHTDGSTTPTTAKTSDNPEGDPQVTDTADLKTTKIADKTNYLPGEPITYTIQISNSGPATAKTPTVSDDVPSNVQNPQYSTDNGKTWNAWSGSLTLPDLAANSSSSVLIKGNVSKTATGSLNNTATVTSPTPHTDGSTTPVTGTTAGSPGGDPKVTDTADVKSTKTSDKTNYLPGESITYTIRVNNTGPAVAKAPKVSDSLPPQVENPVYSTDNGTTWNPWTGSTTLADMPPGETQAVLIKGTVSKTATGTLANTAETSSPTPHTDGSTTPVVAKTSDNTDGDPKVTDTADITTTKTADKVNYLPGEPITYTIVVNNNGPATAKNPEVKDNVPAIVEQPQYSTDNGTTWQSWPGSLTLPDLAAKTSSSVLIKGTVSKTATGSLNNTATVTTPTPHTDGSTTPATGTTTGSPGGDPKVTDTADLTSTKTSDKTDYLPGETITYTITVKNNGPATSTAPKVSDDVPAQIEQPQYSTDNGTTWNPWTGSTTLEDMPNGQTRAVLIRGTISQTATGNLANSAQTSSPTPRSDGSTTPVIAKTSDNADGDPKITDTADVITTKVADKVNYLPGDPISYAIHVTNNGPATAKTPLVSDTVPSQIENPQYSIDNGTTWQGWPGSLTLADLAARSSTTVLIKGTVSKTATGSLNNSATTTTSTVKKDGSPNTSTGTTTGSPGGDPKVTDTADLVSTKVSDKKEYLPGETINYVIRVTNNGPATSTSPTVKDQVPSQIENPLYSTDNGSTWNPWNGSAVLADLPSGQTQAVMIRGTVSQTATGSLANVSETTSKTPRTDGSTTPSTAKTSDNTPDGDPKVIDTADVVTTKAADKVNYLPGDPITYTIHVVNNGPAAAKTPTVTDDVPASIEHPQYSVDNGVTWQDWSGSLTLPDLAAKSSASVLVKGTVSKTATGSLNNRATTTSPTANKKGEPNTSTGTTTGSPGGDPKVTDTANLTSTKVSDKKNYLPGETVTYTITVHNDGPATSTAPAVKDSMPDQIENPEYSTDNGTTWSPWTGSVVLADMPAGQTTAVMIRGKVNQTATGTLANTAEISSKTPHTDGSTTPVTAKTSDSPNGDPAVTDTADLELKKTVSSTALNSGDPITYTITVKNNGPATSAAPVITDSVPSSVEHPEYSVDNGATWKPWAGSVTLPDLPKEAMAAILIRGTLAANASGDISNSATVSSVTQDPNPNDNTTSSPKTTVTPIAKLSMTKTTPATNVNPGDQVVYTLHTDNAGPATAVTPTVNDTVPDEIENPEYSVDGGTSWKPWIGSVTLSDLPAGQSADVLIRGKVASTASGKISNTATVTSPTKNPSPENATGKSDIVSSDSAKIITTKTASPKTAIPDQSIVYTISVENQGPAVAKAPTVNDTISANVVNPEYSVDGGATWSPWKGSTTLPDMAKDTVKQVLIRGRVSQNPGGVIENTVVVVSDSPDPTDPSTRKATITTGTNTTSDLVTTMVVDQPTPKPGDTLTYTVTVRNDGPSAATSPTLSYSPPAQLTNVEYSKDGGKTWSPWSGGTVLENIPNGDSANILMRGKVSNTATGTISSTVTATAPNGDPNPSNNTATTDTPVTPMANIKTEKMVDQEPVLPGDTITYTIAVTNSGPAVAKTPTITDDVPASVEHPQYSVDNGATWQAWNGSATLPDISANTTSAIMIKGTVAQGSTGKIDNTATVTTPTPGTGGGSTTSTISTPIADTAELSSSKSADKKKYLPGETITYAIQTMNHGPATAQAPTISDTVPEKVKNPEYSKDNGATWAAWSGSTTLADIPAGQTTTLFIRGTVSQTATGTLANIATTTSPTPGKDGTDTSITSKTSDSPDGDPSVTDTAKVTSVKTADKNSVKPGEVLTYTLTVANDGPAAAKTPTVTDQVPSDLEAVQYSLDNGVTWANWSGSTSLPDLPVGTKAIVLIRGTVSKNTTNNLTNTASVTTPTPGTDGKTTPVTSTPTTTNVTPVSDLVTTVTVNNDNPKPGDTVTYTVTTTNNGPATANTPTVNLTPPPELTDVEYSTDGGKTWTPWTGSTTRPNIPSGQSDQVLIRGKIKENTTGTVTTSVTTTSTNEDPTPGNNTGTVTVPVKDVAKVTSTKTADKHIAKPGDTLTYTVTVANDGPAVAKTPVVSDRMHDAIESAQYSLDGGTTWAAWTGSTVLPDLQPGAKANVQIRGIISKSTTGSLSNTATVTTPTPGTDGTNTPVTSTPTTTSVTPTSDLVTTVTVNNDNPKPGDLVTYTVTTKNNGPATATEPIVSLTPPPQLSNVEYSTDGGNTWTSWTGTTTRPDLPNGGTDQVLIRGKIKDNTTGAVTTNVTTTSSNEDPTPANNTGTSTVTVKDVANVTATKTADKTLVKPGQVLTYTITVLNDGPATAKTPTISDRMHNALENPQYSTDNGVTWAPWTGSAVLPDLAAGTKATVQARGTVSKATPPGNLENIATVTTTTPGRDGTNTPVTSTTANTNVTPAADLVTTVTPDRDNPIPGDDITYLISVKNNGPATATDPQITFSPPQGLNAVEYSRDGGVTWVPWTGTTTIPSIPNGGTEMVLVRGRVSGDVTNITNTIVTRSLTEDPEPNNNVGTTNTPVKGTAGLKITKAADKAIAKIGDTITYTMSVTNEGPSTAITPTIRDRIPAGLDTLKYSIDGGATWESWIGSIILPDLEPNMKATVLVKGIINKDAAGTFSNTARVISRTPGLDGTMNPVISEAATTLISTHSYLVTTVTADKENPKPGDLLTYNVTVKNDGASTATKPLLSYTPPTQLTNVEYSTDGGNTWTPWTGSATLVDIPSGGSDQLKIRGKVTDTASGTVTTNMRATSPNDEPSVENNTATVVTPVRSSAGVTLSKTVDKTAIKPGEMITYSITVSNSGPMAAKTPTVNDQVPAALEKPQYSTDGGVTWAAWSGSTILPDLAANADARVLIRGMVGKNVTEGFTNRATVTTPTPGPDGTNTPVTGTPVTTNVTPISDLVTTVNVDNDTPKPGDIMTYSILIKNNGPSTAKDPEIGFRPPKDLTNVEYTTDGGKTWVPWTGTTTINDLPDGGTKQLQIRGKIVGDKPDLTSTITTNSHTSDPNTDNNTVTTIPVVNNEARVVTTITADKEHPNPGDELIYTITARNIGPATAMNPNVNYRPPRGLTNVVYSTDGGKTWNPWTGTTPLENIPNGGSAQVLVKGKIDGDMSGDITTTVTTTINNSPPDTGNNTATVTTPVKNTADISIVKSADKMTVIPGETITYTITVANGGPAAAKTPTVSDKLPEAIVNPQYSIDGAKTWAAWPGSVILLDLDYGSKATVLIRGTVSNTASGNLSNTASVTTPTPGKDGTNIPVTSMPTTTIVSTPVSVSDLVTTVTVNNNNPKPGDKIMYTVTIKNNGPATAPTPEVGYKPPSGLTNVEYSIDGGHTWKPWTGTTTLSDIPNGGTAQILIRGDIDGSVTGVLTTSVTATSSNRDPNMTDNTGTVQINVVQPPAPCTCCVKFYRDNCLMATKYVTCGTSVMPPEPQVNTDCSFGGWYTDCSLKCPWNFDHPVNSNMKLYARWIPNSGRRPWC